VLVIEHGPSWCSFGAETACVPRHIPWPLPLQARSGQAHCRSASHTTCRT
jgi:hypothetical protein